MMKKEKKRKIQYKRLRADNTSAQTPYENLIDSLRHAYDEAPRVKLSSDKENKTFCTASVATL